MNGTPHTHELKVTWDRYDQAYEIAYGDTRVSVELGPCLAWRLNRATRKAIRKHDRGSVRAAKAAEAREALIKKVNTRLAAVNEALAPIQKTGWGSDTL